MEEIKRMAERICKKRVEVFEEIKQEEEAKKREEERKIIENTKYYVAKLLNIFEVSNTKEGLFFELSLGVSGKHLECRRSTNDMTKSGFVYNPNDLQVDEGNRKLVVDAILAVNNLEIETEYLELIALYFEENLSEYVCVLRENSGCIRIKMKELSDCEKNLTK